MFVNNSSNHPPSELDRHSGSNVENKPSTNLTSILKTSNQRKQRKYSEAVALNSDSDDSENVQNEGKIML